MEDLSTSLISEKEFSLRLFGRELGRDRSEKDKNG
jgi:hypothetical protein